MNPDGMSLEEMRALLDKLGIPHDQWGAAGDTVAQPPMIEKYKALLVKVRDLLAQQIKDDVKKQGELHAVLQQALHGGGVHGGP